MLFGSRARGDHTQHSDADVAVLLRGVHQRLLPTQLAMADAAFDVLPSMFCWKPGFASNPCLSGKTNGRTRSTLPILDS
jgi:predicted nucleotidyltransferase